MSQTATYKIEEVAELAKCSVRTVRNKIKDKTIPQPLKRKSDREPLRWRQSDIRKHFGIEGAKAANDEGCIFTPEQEALIDEKIKKAVAFQIQLMQQMT